MANKARNQTDGKRNAPWFEKRVEKNRKKQKAARKARKKNRGR